MKTNLLTWMCISVVTLGLALSGSAAFAKDKGENPSGWTKGEKKGWHGSEVPPGLTDKEKKAKGEESEKADKEVKKTKNNAEREAKKSQREAEKARKKVEKESKKSKKEAEKNAKKNAEKLGV